MSLENNFLPSWYYITKFNLFSFFFFLLHAYYIFLHGTSRRTYVPSHGVPLNWKQKQKVKTRMSRGTSVCNSRDQSLPPTQPRDPRVKAGAQSTRKDEKSTIDNWTNGRRGICELCKWKVGLYHARQFEISFESQATRYPSV